MRALVVEDDPMIGRSVQQGLRQDGYAVDWLRDGQAAESTLATTPYDILLLDARRQPLMLKHNGAGYQVEVTDGG